MRPRSDRPSGRAGREAGGARLRARPPHPVLHLRALAGPALAGRDRRPCGADHDACAPPVPALVRPHAQGLPRRRSRSRTPGRCSPTRPPCSMPASSSACPAPAACTTCSSPTRRMTPGEWQDRRRGRRHALRLPPVALRRGDPRRDRDAGWPGSASSTAATGPSRSADMRRRWPRATFAEDAGRDRRRSPRRVFDPARWSPETPLRVVLIGTDFEVRVWETLLRIPLGRATTYSSIATPYRPADGGAGRRRGRRQEPDLVRGALPPRARPLRRRSPGYHWGLTRKQAMLGWESGRLGALSLNRRPRRRAA